MTPRPEYPRPQFQRDRWLNLNGPWQFEIDAGDTGAERGLCDRPLTHEIMVPFCPEAKLSGIENTDFLNVVWYRREVEIPAEWEGHHVLLHFQAVDYEATVWVNGQEVARHRGGFTPFTCHLQGVVGPGEKAIIIVRARDLKHEPKAAGKQSLKHGNYGCFYTRTTGIWQTVWMEPVSAVHLLRPRITPNVGRRRFVIEQPLSNNRPGTQVRATLAWQGRPLTSETVSADHDRTPQLELTVPDDCLHLWGPGEGHLYDITLELLDATGSLLDRAQSYAGLRAIAIDGRAVKINGRPVFQRQILDQGYYPDGIMTAPSEEDLIRDITLSMEAGFNSARLHQKVFEERFLYHCDRLGYLVWGEFPDWGMWGAVAELHPKSHDPYTSAVAQWLEALERDYNHPAIIGWCGLNETGPDNKDQLVALDDLTRAMFLAAKSMDKSRLVLDVSGYGHRVRETDVYDTHDYEQDPEKLSSHYARLGENEAYCHKPALNLPGTYHGQPFFVSEFGGIKWNPSFASDEESQETSWGYGETPRTVEEFHERFEGQCRVLMENRHLFGFCYTQLTDTFQEQNGIVYFDRTPKFDLARIRAVLTRPAAIESAESGR